MEGEERGIRGRKSRCDVKQGLYQNPSRPGLPMRSDRPISAEGAEGGDERGPLFSHRSIDAIGGIPCLTRAIGLP